MASSTDLITKFASRGPIYWRLSKMFPLKPDYRHGLLKRLPKHARCAEIGVWKGDFSQRIMDYTDPERLYLVDPWSFQADKPNRRYGGKHAKSQGDMDNIFLNVCRKFEDFSSVIIARETSHDFFENLKDDLDWVYIDGDHGYVSVQNDLIGAFKVLSKDGLVCGDDYFWRDTDGKLSVKMAVDEYVCANKCRLEVIGSQYLIHRF